MDASQTKIYIAILVTSFIVGVILLYFIVSLVRQQRQNSKLYQLKIAAEITTLENERQRIAADLHDELGPVLSAIKFKLGSIDVIDAEDAVQMEESCNYLDDIISRMREISNDLMPVALLNKGLITAVNEFVSKLPSSTGLAVQFTYTDLLPLSKENTINLYRVIQEIIHNTIKHAAAKTLSIELELSDSKLYLVTRDDGKGFDYQAATKEYSGLGLRNILSRTDMMNGQLYIDSKPGKGSIFTVEVPL
jgi:two-component system NarL family sensor kinase